MDGKKNQWPLKWPIGGLIYETKTILHEIAPLQTFPHSKRGLFYREPPAEHDSVGRTPARPWRVRYFSTTGATPKLLRWVLFMEK